MAKPDQIMSTNGTLIQRNSPAKLPSSLADPKASVPPSLSCSVLKASVVVNYASSKAKGEEVVKEIAALEARRSPCKRTCRSQRKSNACLPNRRGHLAGWTSWSTTRASMSSCPWRR